MGQGERGEGATSLGIQISYRPWSSALPLPNLSITIVPWLLKSQLCQASTSRVLARVAFYSAMRASTPKQNVVGPWFCLPSYTRGLLGFADKDEKPSTVTVATIPMYKKK